MEMVSYKNSLKSLSSSMYQAKVVEQNQLMECLYKVFSDYVNSKIKYTILYKKLLEYGFSNSQLSKIVYGFDEVYLTKDDKGNYLSLITKHSCSEHLGNVIINPYCDGFFGSRFDKNLGYLTVTSDKIAAVTSGLTNYVSFNNAPSKFFLSKKKLEMIRKYGNKVVVADCSGAEYIRLQMIANHIEVI